MSKEAVVYRSKTGYTRCYAEWIAMVLECDLLELSQVSIEELMEYDTLIIGGGIYVGNINGLQFILKNYDKLSEKRLYLFAVGLDHMESEHLEQIWSRQLTREQRKVIKCYYLRGGLNYSKLNLWDKCIIKLFQAMMKTSKKGMEKTSAYFESLDKPSSYIKKENINQLIKDVERGRLVKDNV